MLVIESQILVWLSLAVIAAAMVLYASDWLPMEMTSLLVLLTLVMLFWLFPLPDASGQNQLDAMALLAGFGNPALITIMGFLVLAQALFQSGALEVWIHRLSRIAEQHPLRAVVGLLISVGVASAFLNNTPMVLMAIPILASMAMRMGGHDSRFMMSLSFISILGGMTTLIGSSTNLLVAEAVRHDFAIGFFTQSVPGLVLAGVGTLYVLLVLPSLLRRGGPRSQSAEADDDSGSGRQYMVEVHLRARDPLVGAEPRVGFFEQVQPLTLRMVHSGGAWQYPPFEQIRLAAGDTLLLAATRRQLEQLLRTDKHPLQQVGSFVARRASDEPDAEGALLAEVVVAPGSRMSGRTIYQTGFAYETGCTIVGVQRQEGTIRQLSQYRLVGGDVLLVMGPRDAIEKLRSNRDVLPMEWRTSNVPSFATARRARWIFLAAIFSAASGLVPIIAASLGGATAMLFARVLNLRQAVRGLSMRIFLLVAAALAMATALERTGGAAWLSESLVLSLGGFSPAIMLSVLFLLCALCTNVLSNNATAVLFTPIALSLAQQLQAPVAPFIMAVIFAANCSFATPIAYQTNLLVMTPGRYRFKDFVRAGSPLVILLWLAYSLFAPWYYDL